MSASIRPKIVISLGDPGGIGPEIVAKSLSLPEVRQACRAIVVGEADALNKAARIVKADVEFVPAASTDGEPSGNAVPVIEPPNAPRGPFPVGRIAAENGHAANAWLLCAIDIVRSGEADAICTAPIAKEAMFAAGFRFPGHTELLASRCGGYPVRMMLEGGGVRVVLETIHMALSAVPGRLKRESIAQTLKIGHDWAARFVTPAPRIGVCGLNPHAGEGGHFGNEEIEVIGPAIESANANGVQAFGPFPADTIFHRMLQGEFDMVAAMYHDQGLVAVKTLDFHRGVNITIGLPIIRTSPDHGTAFDIAGKGIAHESSMATALARAAQLAARERDLATASPSR